MAADDASHGVSTPLTHGAEGVAGQQWRAYTFSVSYR
jgi:hypothetical protein